MFLLAAGAAAAACGKKGPPLAPIQRIPGQVTELDIRRQGDEVLLDFTVPTANADGRSPADIARVEVYAITATETPDAADYSLPKFRESATLVATVPVRPPAPPPVEGEPPPPPPAGPGLDQGQQGIVRETLDAAARTPVPLPELTRQPRASTGDDEPAFGPIVMPPPADAVRRFYFVVAVSDRGRYGLVSPLRTIPVDAPSAAPRGVEVAYDETTVTLTWEAPADARQPMMQPGAEDALPARPLVPGAQPTRYNVYEPAGPDAPPAPLNPAPLDARTFSTEVGAFGRERCFVVRAVDVVADLEIEGPASDRVCATLEDTFPPAAPTGLAAVASGAAISLIWDASDAADLEGYLVLRGEAPGATLQTLTRTPIRETTFRDATAQPGVRYVYAVVAVDAAGNASGQSARVEETLRQ